MARDNRMQTVEKALRVLSAFPPDGREVSLTELSASTAIERSIVYRILYTLGQQGFAAKSHATRRYRLGKKVFELGQIAAIRQDLRQLALPVMRQLSETTGESVLLCVHSDGEGVCVEGVEPPGTSIRFATRVGERFPLHAGAAGKVLLALQPDEVLEGYLRTPLRRYTLNTITDPARLRPELAAIRARGYATSYGEVEAGAQSVAAPIRDHSGAVVAEINLVGPAFRLTRRRLRKLAPVVVAAAHTISLALGHAAPQPIQAARFLRSG